MTTLLSLLPAVFSVFSAVRHLRQLRFLYPSIHMSDTCYTSYYSTLPFSSTTSSNSQPPHSWCCVNSPPSASSAIFFLLRQNLLLHLNIDTPPLYKIGALILVTLVVKYRAPKSQGGFIRLRFLRYIY